MKTTKFFTLLFVACIGLLFTGCGKDDDESSQPAETDLSGITIDQNGTLGGVITIGENGKAVANKAITLSYRTYGGNGTATSTDILLGKTNAVGKITVTGNVTALPRKIQFGINNYTASVIVTHGTVPEGFLTGYAVSSGADLTWDKAKEFSAFHGGRLPRICNADAMFQGNYTDDMLVDGFGKIYGSWPSGIPGGMDLTYWTATEDASFLGQAFGVMEMGRIIPAIATKSTIYQVVCIP